MGRVDPSLLPVAATLAAALTACGDRSTDLVELAVATRAVEVTTGAEKATQPAIAMSRDGQSTYVAWTTREPTNGGSSDDADVSGGTLHVARSVDGGGTFGAPVRVGQPGEVGVEGPELAVDEAGTLFVVWAHRSNGDDLRMRLARSIDGGRTFSAPVEVCTDPSPVVGTRPALTVSPDGRTVVIGWLDLSEGFDSGEPPDDRRPTPIQVAVSRDGGATFGRPVVASPASCSCCNPALAMFRGHPALTWRGQRRESPVWDVRDTMVALSPDDGRTWGPGVTVFDDLWRLNACPVVGPAIVTEAEEALHVAWSTGAESRVGLWYARSEDGRAFSAPVRLSQAPAAPSIGRVALAVDRAGRAWIASADARTGEARVRLWAVPRSGGPHEIRAASVPGRSPRIAVGGDGGALVWSDGNGRVLLRRTSETGR